MPQQKADVHEVILAMDTGQLADNDVATTVAVEIPNVARENGGRVKLVSVQLLDETDQAQDLDLIFTDALVSLGTANGAISINDANARSIVGAVSILIAHYFDLIASQQAFLGGIEKIMKCAEGSSSLWVQAVCRSGTPTYTAASVRLRCAFERY